MDKIWLNIVFDFNACSCGLSTELNDQFTSITNWHLLISHQAPLSCWLHKVLYKFHLIETNWISSRISMYNSRKSMWQDCAVNVRVAACLCRSVNSLLPLPSVVRFCILHCQSVVSDRVLWCNFDCSCSTCYLYNVIRSRVPASRWHKNTLTLFHSSVVNASDVLIGTNVIYSTHRVEHVLL